MSSYAISTRSGVIEGDYSTVDLAKAAALDECKNRQKSVSVYQVTLQGTYASATSQTWNAA